MSAPKIVRAAKSYSCADCRKSIEKGAACIVVNEYGEQRRLHQACWKRRPSNKGPKFEQLDWTREVAP